MPQRDFRWWVVQNRTRECLKDPVGTRTSEESGGGGMYVLCLELFPGEHGKIDERHYME